jgi:hypothetical protein
MESTGALLTIIVPLVAVPLTVITFYLRSSREHQVSRHADLLRRADSLEAAVADLRRALNDFERDYTTKEEWLRECMLARRTLEQLTETTVRIETTMQNLVSDAYIRCAVQAGPEAQPPTGRTTTTARRGRNEDQQ